MTVRQYKGARYVPIFGRVGEESIQWDNTKEYEPLTIVLHEGNSYTSRQYVPIGAEITNQNFWALTGNYNAQIEVLRQDVRRAEGEIEELKEKCILHYLNVNSMIADSENLKAGDCIKTEGFYNSGDCGGGLYVLGESGTANGMDIIEISDSLNAFLIMDESVYLEQLGAKGNDTQDETAILERALNLDKKVILKAEKIYKLTRSLVLTCDSVKISGKGVLHCKFAGNLFNSNLNLCELKDVIFDGNEQNYGVFSNSKVIEVLDIDGIDVSGFVKNPVDESVNYRASHSLTIACNYGTIANSVIRDNTQHGLILFANTDYNEATCENVKITNCTAYNNLGEVALGIGGYCNYEDSNVIVSNCIAYNNKNTGIAPHGVTNQIISNCNSFENGEHGICVMQCQSATVSGNNCRNNSSFGIRLQGDYSLDSEDRFCNNVICSNNIIIGNNGFKIGVDTKEITICNNTIKNVNLAFGLDTQGEGRNGQAEFLNIYNNQISYSSTPSSQYALEAYPHISVVNNFDRTGHNLPDGLLRFYGSTHQAYYNTSDTSQSVLPENYDNDDVDIRAIGSGSYDADTQVLSGTAVEDGVRFRLPITDTKPITMLFRCDNEHTLAPTMWFRDSAASPITDGTVKIGVSMDRNYNRFAFTFVPKSASIKYVEVSFVFEDASQLSVGSFRYFVSKGYKVNSLTVN